MDFSINGMIFSLDVFAFCFRAVTDPRDGRRVALKKLPNVFQSLVSSKRVFRELKMLCFFKHENVSTRNIVRHSYSQLENVCTFRYYQR